MALQDWPQPTSSACRLPVGLGDHHVKKLDLGFVWDPNLTWWQIGDWHFALIGEAHAAWWHTDEGNVHENIGEIGVTPIIRFIDAAGAIRPYIEAGADIRLAFESENLF